jgi:hypothetical protein
MESASTHWTGRAERWASIPAAGIRSDGNSILRRQYRGLLRREIAMTVEGPKTVDEEILNPFAALHD